MSVRKGERFDRRFTAFGIGFPWVVAFCFAAVALILRRGVPDLLGLHWNGRYADLTLAFPAFVLFTSLAIGILGSVCGAVAGARLNRRWLRRLLMGAAVFFSLLTASAGAALLMGQQGVESANDGGFDGTVFGLGSGAAVALGTIMVFTFQPDPRWTAQDERALAEATAALAGSPRISFWVHARSSSFVFLAITVLLIGGLLLLLSPWISATLALLVIIVTSFLFGKVTLPGGNVLQPHLRVRAAGIMPVLDLPLEQICGVEVVEVRVWELGGPGARWPRSGTQFLTRNGFALRLETAAHPALLISTPSRALAEELAGQIQRRLGLDAEQ